MTNEMLTAAGLGGSFSGRLLERCRFGILPGATIAFSSSDVACWGLARQFGRGGTMVVARLLDGREVIVARSHQNREARRVIDLATKGLLVSHPVTSGLPVTFAWAHR